MSPEQLASDLHSPQSPRPYWCPGTSKIQPSPPRSWSDAAEKLGGFDALVMSHTESVELRNPRHHRRELRPALRGQRSRHLAAAGGLRPAAAGKRRTSVVALTSDHTVGNLPYGVTKGEPDRLVLAAAHELADAGVRANVINPGPIDTGWMTDDVRARRHRSAADRTPRNASGHSQSCPVPAVRARWVDQRPAALQQRGLPKESASSLIK